MVIIVMPCKLSSLVADGSTRGACSACKQAVWISPTTQRLLEEADGPYDFMCLECVKLSDVANADPVPGSVEEAIENIRKDEARSN